MKKAQREKIKIIVLDYRDVVHWVHIFLPAKLWTNHVETSRLATRFTTPVSKQQVNIPDYLLRELLWPSHIPLPLLENPTGDEPDAGGAISSLVKVPLPLSDRFPSYTHGPRHMLCLTCLSDVSRSKFWSWWEVQRRLPPVSAPDQLDCGRGLDCDEQTLTEHAAMYNVSGFFDKLRSPALLC